jgi:hypothetical protein
MKPIKALFILLIFAASFFLLNSCKKCTTCTARDTVSGDVKFEEKTCSTGPLLDDWEKDIKNSYPEPEYNTVCK